VRKSRGSSLTQPLHRTSKIDFTKSLDFRQQCVVLRIGKQFMSLTSKQDEGINIADQRAFGGEVSEYFVAKTRELINEKSFGSTGGSRKQIDIIRDVINRVPILWLSHASGVRQPRSQSRVTIIENSCRWSFQRASISQM
jgi:hypothetical protein